MIKNEVGKVKSMLVVVSTTESGQEILVRVSQLFFFSRKISCHKKLSELVNWYNILSITC